MPSFTDNLAMWGFSIQYLHPKNKLTFLLLHFINYNFVILKF